MNRLLNLLSLCLVVSSCTKNGHDGANFKFDKIILSYTFIIKGKPVTIDIGFNFYDVNAKNWVWRKKTEYD